MPKNWKTITGSILFGLGSACKAAAYFMPDYAAGLNAIGDLLIAAGGSLGGIGLRLAIEKNKQK